MLVQQRNHFHNMTFRMTEMFIIILVCSIFLFNVVNSQEDETERDAIYRARELAKPWLMRRIEFGDTKLPFSPASVITFVIVILNIGLRLLGGGSWAEASHILVKDTSDKTQKAMVSMKNDIGGSLKKFEEYAHKYSQCPSRDQKGDLGRFKPGAMAPSFNDAVFDPKNQKGKTLGPIRTQFGYHLIYIRDRKI